MPESPQPETALTLTMIRSLADIAPGDWNACANPPERAFDPFLCHEFLWALETSGSADGTSGWAAHHMIATIEGESRPVAVMPVYLKSHSYGEYVFDWGWADAFERAGGRYYPKFQISVPFTPAAGRRVLTRPGFEAVADALTGAIMDIAAKNDISSVHWTFLPEDAQQSLAAQGCLTRQDQQFHWHNRDYRSFEDFLAALSSRKRKQIRKERARAVENDIEITVLTGGDLREEHWDAFYGFYTDTGLRKWGTPYLTREFFSHSDQTMAEHIALVMCRRDGKWIAGALNFIGAEVLYGRNWGAAEDHPCLHFEACYYQAIEFAIARGLKRVEAGAQGPHKIARGYEPALTFSAHWIANPSLRGAVAHFLDHEKRAVAEDVAYLADRTPFKKGDS